MNRRTGLRKFTVFLLAFLLALHPVAPLFAQNSYHSTSADFQSFSESDLRQFSEDGVTWSDEQESKLKDLFTLAAMLDKEAEEYAAENGEEALQQSIETNLFVREIKSIGKIEYRMIDGKRVPKAVLYSNDKAYLLLDEAIVPRHSSHLRQYISRVHMEAGTDRPDLDENGILKRGFFGGPKAKIGRDLTIVALREGKISDVSYMPKPKPTQWTWWKEYFVSKYKKPSINDFTLALTVGSLTQGGLTAAMAAIKTWALGTTFTLEPTMFTALYALGLGTIVSTYRNWTTLTGTRFTRVLKSTAVSLAYAYGLVLFLAPGEWSDKFASISILSSAGLMQNLSISLNAVSNNYAKDFWNQIMKIRDKTRANAKPVKFNFLGIQSLPVEWKRASIESQLLYLIPWTINLISLMSLATTDMLKIPGTEISVPILQLAAIPIAMLWARAYARRLADKAAKDPRLKDSVKELEEMANTYDRVWKESFGMDVKEIPSRLVGRIKMAYRSCVDALRRNRTDDSQ